MFPEQDYRIIRQIARRAADVYSARGIRIDPEYIASELAIVHKEIVCLRLKEMNDAAEFDLMHDVDGIHRHLEIRANESVFTHCFLPRFAVHRVSLRPDAA